LLSRSSGSRSGLAPLASADVKHRKVEVAGLQRTPRLLDRIDRNDVGNFAESASDDIVVVDVKDSRTSVGIRAPTAWLAAA
jgi:hypothetical protein